MLYGADLAKREIAHRRQAVIVEGYTDVMACHLAGVPTAVATSGTSFGDGHVKVLRRLLMDADQFLGEVVFTFDGDAAGQRAVAAGVRPGGAVRHADLRGGAARRAGPVRPAGQARRSAVRDLVARRVPLFEFAIRSKLAKITWTPTKAASRALDAAARIIARIKDRGLRNRYAFSLDRWLGMLNEEFVLARVARARGQGTGQAGGAMQGSGRRPSPEPGRAGRTAARDGGGPAGPAARRSGHAGRPRLPGLAGTARGGGRPGTMPRGTARPRLAEPGRAGAL